MDSTKPAIAVAFEGVISEGLLGEHIGHHQAVLGAMDALAALHRKYRIVIYTSNPSSKFEEISDWITRNKGSRYFTFEITNQRPAATYYIEKRSIKFDNWENVLSLLGG